MKLRFRRFLMAAMTGILLISGPALAGTSSAKAPNKPRKAQPPPPFTYPGGPAELPSPDGRYVLLNVDSGNGVGATELGDLHALFLLDRRTGARKMIHPYGRSIEVLWSPRGTRLLVNVDAASNFTFPLIFTPGKGMRREDPWQRMFERLQEEESLWRNDYIIVRGVEWLGEDRVRLRAEGRGRADPGGFEAWYEYPVEGRTIKRLSFRSPTDIPAPPGGAQTPVQSPAGPGQEPSASPLTPRAP